MKIVILMLKHVIHTYYVRRKFIWHNFFEKLYQIRDFILVKKIEPDNLQSTCKIPHLHGILNNGIVIDIKIYSIKIILLHYKWFGILEMFVGKAMVN